jgi:hypothetical protein
MQIKLTEVVANTAEKTASIIKIAKPTSRL